MRKTSRRQVHQVCQFLSAIGGLVQGFKDKLQPWIDDRQIGEIKKLANRSPHLLCGDTGSCQQSLQRHNALHIDRQDARRGIECPCLLRKCIKVNRNNLNCFDSMSDARVNANGSGRDVAVRCSHRQVAVDTNGDLVSHVAMPIMIAYLP